MTDNQSTIAGNYRNKGGAVIECILDEGAPTYKGVTIMPDGQTVKTATFATPLEQGQIVALSNDTACTFAATEGMPVVERPVTTETFVIGEIISVPQLKRFPSATDADDDTLAERLAGKYYRTALVEFHVPGRVVKAQFMCNGTNALVQGNPATGHFNITSGSATGARGYYLDAGASAGAGYIPLHYCPAGTDGDLYSVMILVTGLIYAITGA